MCVFNRVMVDSGTIGFIASQEMARKQGRGAGSLEVRGPGGLNNSTAPGLPRLHPGAGHSECAAHVLPAWEGWVGHRTMPAWPQARQVMAAGNFSVESLVSHHVFSCSASLKLTGLEGMQVKQSCGLHFSAASEEESTKRSTWTGEVAAGSLGPWRTRKMWSLSLILNKIKGNSNQKEVKMLATLFFPSLG